MGQPLLPLEDVMNPVVVLAHCCHQRTGRVRRVVVHHDDLELGRAGDLLAQAPERPLEELAPVVGADDNRKGRFRHVSGLFPGSPPTGYLKLACRAPSGGNLSHKPGHLAVRELPRSRHPPGFRLFQGSAPVTSKIMRAGPTGEGSRAAKTYWRPAIVAVVPVWRPPLSELTRNRARKS